MGDFLHLHARQLLLGEKFADDFPNPEINEEAGDEGGDPPPAETFNLISNTGATFAANSGDHLAFN